MASWVDGPEYAPLERPAAFAEPQAAPLEQAPVVHHPAAGAPVEQPAFQQPQEPVTPLDRLVPSAGPTRDAREAFDVASSAMTSQSAWGAAHSGPQTALAEEAWSPEQPFEATATTQVNYPPPSANFPAPHVNPPSFPAPGTPGWFAPPDPYYRAGGGPQPVTLAQMWDAATPGVIIPLVVGAFISWVSIIMLALSFALSSRVKYRRRTVRGVFGGAAGFLGLVLVLAWFSPDTDLASIWDLVSVWALVLCWILPVTIMLIVGAGLRAGEAPERQF